MSAEQEVCHCFSATGFHRHLEDDNILLQTTQCIFTRRCACTFTTSWNNLPQIYEWPSPVKTCKTYWNLLRFRTDNIRSWSSVKIRPPACMCIISYAHNIIWPWHWAHEPGTRPATQQMIIRRWANLRLNFKLKGYVSRQCIWVIR